MMDRIALAMVFQPDADERARILRGENVYISLLTFGHPMQPIIVLVGKRDAALAFGLAPSP